MIESVTIPLAQVGTIGRHVLDADAAARAFAAERKACDRALASEDALTVSDVRLAGYVIRLRIAGARLASRLLEAFIPTAAPAPGDTADLTVDIWDSSEHTTAPKTAELWDRLRSDDGHYFLDATPRVVNWLDRVDHRMLVRVSSTHRLTPGDVYQPFSSLLALWLADRETPAIHAGAVGHDGDVVLITGRSGSGKSTAALSCLLAGFDYLGDDFIVLQRSAGAWLAHAAYRTAHLESTHLARFPRLAAAVPRPPAPNEGKSVICIDRAFAGQPRRTARVRGIVMPRIVPGGRTELRSAPKSAALLAMAPSSLLMRPAGTPAAFDAVAALAAAVPTYWLEMGSTLSAIPQALNLLLPPSHEGKRE
jgi:hypothetical protein